MEKNQLSQTGELVHSTIASHVANLYVNNLNSYREGSDGKFPTLRAMFADLATRSEIGRRFRNMARRFKACRLEPRWNVLEASARYEIKSMLELPQNRDLADKLDRIRREEARVARVQSVNDAIEEMEEMDELFAAVEGQS